NAPNVNSVNPGILQILILAMVDARHSDVEGRCKAPDNPELFGSRLSEQRTPKRSDPQGMPR
ncbi:MAG: hypothetical protein KDC85_10500, partial [Saprospiraceae bacterium]|nr:hypothetical protein [Saprospiraceae bacterium]